MDLVDYSMMRFSFGRVGWVIVAVIIIVIVIAGSILVFHYFTPPNPSSSVSPSANKLTINIYAGEINSSLYGFGNSSGTISSPGPDYTVKEGTTVTVNFHNAGAMPHNWAMVTEKSDAVDQLVFPDAHIGDSLNPIAPAQSVTCTFVADKPGTYYYICQVDSHVTLGMWGYFTVTP